MDTLSQVARWAAHKDAPVTATIKRARQILELAGFNPQLVVEKQVFDGCFSCHLAEPSLPTIFSNGKGCTRELSVASAYMEFIERLQCYCDARLRHLGLIVSKPSFFFPELLPAELVVDSHPQIISELLPPDYDLPVEELECIQFCDLTEGRLLWLPSDLMLKLTQSNGMCAGNSPEEALVQGCCEVMERAVIKELATGRLRGLPTIGLQELNLSRGIARTLVEELVARGLKVIVKDATLGGRWPVLGVVIIDEKTGAFSLGFGADPVMEVALARCITEAMQGRGEPYSHTLEKVSPILNLPTAWYYHEPQLTVWNLLDDYPPTGDFRRAFLPATTTNAEMLKNILLRLKGEGRRVIVRDFSFLGIPTYYVYITGLSRLFALDQALIDLLLKDYHWILQTLFSLPQASAQQLGRWARVMCAQLWRPRDVALDRSVENLFGRVPVVEWMDLRLLLVIILMKIGDWPRALAAARSQLTKEKFFNSPDPQALMVMAGVCELKMQGLKDHEIARRITESMASNPYSISVGHLLQGHYASFLSKAPQEAKGKGVEALPVPRCLSLWHCQDCPCRKRCYVKGWLKLSARVEKLARPVDQHPLLGRITSLLS